MASTAGRGSIVWRTRLSNLFGAVMAFLYLRFIDPVTAGPEVTWAEVGLFAAGFTALTLSGVRLVSRWAAPMFSSDASSLEARRSALLFPWVVAGVTLLSWVMAGLIWGVVAPLLLGRFSVPFAVRSVVGITVVGGVVTTVIVFFSVDSRWRQELPRFFPAGDLGDVRHVPRLPVRARLLVVFLLTSVGPLLLLAIVVWRRSRMVAADPAHAGQMLGEMLAIIGFFTVAGLVAAVRLSWTVSDSVAAPLVGLTFAMARVERGDLDERCAVVSNDEIGAVAEGFNRMLDGLREREAIKETFGRYVTREVRDEILAGRVTVEGEQREVTVLFADLRDFTPWVESTEPRQVVRDLNGYFAEMEAAIRAHGGLVLQFIGDEIEAVRSTCARACTRGTPVAPTPCVTASACTPAPSSPAPSAAASGSRTRSSATPSTWPPASRA